MLCLLLTLWASASANLVYKLDTSSDHVDFQQHSFLVRYEITNVAQEPVTFLPWKTPLDTVWEDIFVVKDEAGNEMAYTGKEARRAPTTPDMWVVMDAGESWSVMVDLTRSYLLPEDGTYSVSMRALNTSVEVGAPTYSNTVSLMMKFSNTEHALARYELTSGFGTDFNSCDSGQTRDIQDAYDIAFNTHTVNARNCLASASGPSCSVYTTWMGRTSLSQYTTVRNCWANIQRDLPSANYYCCPSGCGRNCGPGLYAYVFPSDPNMVHHICQAFWDIPNERAETITHEQSHFTVTCGTDDFAYGRPACASLALTDVSRAIRNADNHCFFGSDAP